VCCGDVPQAVGPFPSGEKSRTDQEGGRATVKSTTQVRHGEACEVRATVSRCQRLCDGRNTHRSSRFPPRFPLQSGACRAGDEALPTHSTAPAKMRATMQTTSCSTVRRAPGGRAVASAARPAAASLSAVRQAAAAAAAAALLLSSTPAFAAGPAPSKDAAAAALAEQLKVRRSVAVVRDAYQPCCSALGPRSTGQTARQRTVCDVQPPGRGSAACQGRGGDSLASFSGSRSPCSWPCLLAPHRPLCATLPPSRRASR
jgi:hypothetical protein